MYDQTGRNVVGIMLALITLQTIFTNLYVLAGPPIRIVIKIIRYRKVIYRYVKRRIEANKVTKKQEPESEDDESHISRAAKEFEDLMQDLKVMMPLLNLGT